MNRQQLGITFIGVAAVAAIVLVALGGPNFESSCTGSCEGQFEAFLREVFMKTTMLTLAVIFGLTGTIMLVLDGLRRPAVE